MERLERQLHEIHELLKRVLHHQEKLMSAVSDFAVKVQANFDSIQTGINTLDAEIQALQNSTGTLSASDQAALDSISAKSAALATAANAAVPVPVPPVGS